MNKFRIIWIGATADKKYLDLMAARGNRQSTAYSVQKKFIKGLRSNGVCVHTLNGHVMPAFPRYKGVWVPSRIWKTDENQWNIDASFVNLPLINLYSKGKGLIRASKKIDVKKEDVLVVYSLHSPFLKTALYLKKRTGCKVVVIIPDLPEYMNSRQSMVRRILKRLDRVFIDNYLTKMDGYVLFAQKMEKFLPVKKNKMTVEGILEYDEHRYLQEVLNVKDIKKVVMYSGNINLSEGIERLLDIFAKVKINDCELWITGTGDGEKLILNRAEKDDRIKYLGYIVEYEKLLELQKKAKVMVAMVDPMNPKSDVFFPSKIMEYLLTGREVMCYKLGCIPNEYDSFIKYFDYESVEISAGRLENMLNLSLDEIQEDGRKRTELLKKKDLLFQSERLINFIDEVQK